MESFSETTLIENGFILAPGDLSIQFKKRRAVSTAANDIHLMGLAMHENLISNKLAIELLLPQYVKESTVNDIMNSNQSRIIIEKLQELIDINRKVCEDHTEMKKKLLASEQQNSELKQHILALERKIDSMNQSNNSERQKIGAIISKLQSDSASTAASNPIVPPPNIPPISWPSVPSPPMDPPTKEQQQPCKTKQTEQISVPSRTSVTNTSSSNRRPIFGDKRPTKVNITGTTKPISLFVGGFNPSLQVKDIKNIIEKDIHIKVLRIESNKINKHNQSVRVDINGADKDRAFSEATWFAGLIVKPFRLPRNHSRQETYENQPRFDRQDRFPRNSDHHRTYQNQHLEEDRYRSHQNQLQSSGFYNSFQPLAEIENGWDR